MSSLEIRVETLNNESKRAVKRIEASVSVLAKAIDLNAQFDEMGQVMNAVEADLREFEEVMSSMASQRLDSTTRQEGMEIVTLALKTQAEFLSAADAQTLTTLASRAQSAILEIKFEGESGLCRDAIREVKFVTSVPLMSNRKDYCDAGIENVFKECNPELREEGSIFLVNPYNDFHHTMIQSGKEVKMVTRTFQVYEGTTLVFERSRNHMEDIFTIFLQNQDSISATTWCDGQWSQITITNGSRLLNPLQCGIYSPYNLFFRRVDVRADNETPPCKPTTRKLQELL